MICRLLLNVVSRLVGSSNWGRVCLWTQINISLLLYNGFVCVCLRMSTHLMCVCVHLDLYVQGLNSMCVRVCLQFHQSKVAASKILCASVNFFSVGVCSSVDAMYVCYHQFLRPKVIIMSFLVNNHCSTCPFTRPRHCIFYRPHEPCLFPLSDLREM